ncbi:MAG: flavin reductase [Pseudonocardiaceae bacterium]|nr:flavin reductase [Pseudonocardiaceae bacterium]
MGVNQDEQLSAQLAPRDRFRWVLSHVPTTVVVVTAACSDGPAGLAIGSFTSISLDPPLVGFFPDLSSTSWPRIRSAGRFCVNVLAYDQEDVVGAFAKSGGDKFSGLESRPARGTGSPILDGAIAWIECELDDEIRLGDHFLAVGRVLNLSAERNDPALVFCRGAYTRIA